MVVLGSLLMALGAHVAIPTPLSPVPITGQTFALALVVALLGTRGATLAMVLYIAEGLTGWRVFSPVGLLGPSLGYIIAFPLAAYATGWLFDRGLAKTYPGRVLAIFLGTLVVFAGGACWLAGLFGWPAAIATGVLPFVLGDVLKTLLAAAAAPFVRDAGKGVPQI
jgi:biotin transporter BioY